MREQGKDWLTNEGTIKEEVSLTNDVNLIMAHRSWFIWKKKFDQFDKQIKEIYRNYQEQGTEDWWVDNELVRKIFEEVENWAKFELVKGEDFKDVIKKEWGYMKRVNIGNEIVEGFIEYVDSNRRKYNWIYREKKKNPNINWDMFNHYVPEGEDDLTKVYEEKINNEDVYHQGADEENDDEEEEENNNTKNSKDINKPWNTEESKQEANPRDIDSNNNEPNEEESDQEGNDNNSNKSNDKSEDNEPNEDDDSNNNDIRTEGAEGAELEKKRKQIPITSRIYTKSLIYIETLPLIIADFLSTNPYLVIWDHSDELRDSWRTWFDNEILGRLGEETTNTIHWIKIDQLKDYWLSQSKIEENIRKYEDIFAKLKSENQNTTFILSAISKLQNSKEWLDNKIKTIQNDTNTFNEFENIVSRVNEKYNIQNAISSNAGNSQQRNSNKYLYCSANNSQMSSNNYMNHNTTISNLEPFQTEDHQNKNNNTSNVLSNYYNGNGSYQNKQKTEPNRKQTISNQDVSMNLSKTTINNTSHSLMNKTRWKSKKDMTQEELREIAIKQIFYFYAHQHSWIGYKSTFDSLKNQMEHLNWSEFSKFCVEFKIWVTKEKLIEIFKKTAGNVKDMSWEEFNIAWQKISVAINEEKIRLWNKKIIHLKSTWKSWRGSSTNGNANNNINTIANIQKHDIEVEIQQLKDDIKKLSGKTYQEWLNELFLYLELDDEKEYEKKMKGFNLPFNHSNGKKRVINLPKVQYYAGKSKVLNIQAAKEISKIIEQRRLENDKRKEKDNWEIGLNREYQKKKLEENNNKHSSSIWINTAKNIMSNRGINDEMVSNNRSDSRFIMEKEVKFNNTPLRGDSKKFMVQNAPEVKDNCFSWSSLEKMNSNYFALEDEIKKWIN